MFKGKGMSPQNVKVCHLFDPVIVDEYLVWSKLRSLDQTNEQHKRYLKMLQGLLAPVYGFVTQQPDLAWDFPELELPRLDRTDVSFKVKYNSQKELWGTICATWREVLGTMLGGVVAEIKEGDDRGAKKELATILSRKDPLSVLIQLIQRHGTTRPPGLPLRKPVTLREAKWLRDHILLRLALSNPLRNRNFREMIWRGDNTGNLYCEGEEWRIRFSPGQMKSAGAKKEKYDVSVTAELAPYLESWLIAGKRTPSGAETPSGREVLFQATKRHSDHVFVNDRGRPYDLGSLSKLFARLTGRLLDDLEGVRPFRSHAWRHIVATGYLKDTGDFLTLSFVLHDRLETVMEHYAHLVPQDGFNVYDRWLRQQTAGRL